MLCNYLLAFRVPLDWYYKKHDFYLAIRSFSWQWHVIATPSTLRFNRSSSPVACLSPFVRIPSRNETGKYDTHAFRYQMKNSSYGKREKRNGEKGREEREETKDRGEKRDLVASSRQERIHCAKYIVPKHITTKVTAIGSVMMIVEDRGLGMSQSQVI